jgi:hypothetical protein
MGKRGLLGGAIEFGLVGKFVIWFLVIGFIIAIVTFLVMSIHSIRSTGSYIGNTSDPIVAKTDKNLKMRDGTGNTNYPIVVVPGDPGVAKSIGAGKAFTISFWIYINDTGYKSTQPRPIMTVANTSLLPTDGKIKVLHAASTGSSPDPASYGKFVVSQKNAQRWGNPTIVFRPGNHDIFVRFRFRPQDGVPQFMGDDNFNGNSPFSTATGVPVEQIVQAASAGNSTSMGYSTNVAEPAIREDYFANTHPMRITGIFPNRWTHIIITKPESVDQVLMYVDGRLVRTHDLGGSQIAEIVGTDTEIMLAPLDGFGGFISRAQILAEGTSA